VSYEFDQSPYVIRAIRGLSIEGMLGAVLTGLMVLIFLRDWRTAIIVVLNIPLALLAGALGLALAKQTINIMTLGGLALAVGVLVDEATVTIENIHTHMARGESVAQAAYNATVETAMPRLLAMLSVVAVFIPAFFMVGASRALFVPLALAVGFSMIASYLLASTFVPVLAIWLLRGHENLASEERGKAFSFAHFQESYKRVTLRLVGLRWLLLGVYLLLSGMVIVLAGRQLGTEIFPRVDAGQLQLRLRAPAGTRVEETEAIALEALDIIKKEAGPNKVAITLGFVGVHAPSYPINLIYLWNGGSEEGVLQVQLKPDADVSMEELKERLRQRFARELPGVSFSFEPSDIVSRVMSLGASTPVEIAVSGPNLTANREFAARVKEKLEKIPSLRDLQFGQAFDYPTVDVVVNRERAGVMGVKMAEVSRSLVAATSSSRFIVPNYWADPNSGVAYQIQVQIPQAAMNSLEEARNLPVSYREGNAILLRSIASVKEGTTVGQYERYNMQRIATVTANIAHADLGTVARQVNEAMKELGAPPPKVNLAVRGQVVPMQQMIEGLRTGLLLAIGVIFLLLMANFESIALALSVISTIPAVIAGVALSLWITHTTLNIQSFMGAIMAVGVAVANAILLVTFAERSRMAGSNALESVAEGASSRLRPILMTSLAMMAGMVPMAIGFGEGGEQTAPLGRAVVGGLAAATIATLLFLPAVFAILRARASTRSVSLDPEDPSSSFYCP
jgi:multidrug efflux pump subunit AcrB